jgi:aminobutyraldehyde dehydrogenase
VEAFSVSSMRALALSSESRVMAAAAGPSWSRAASTIRGWNVHSVQSDDSRLDAGTVWVNAHLVLANEVPWGGFKGSGYGRDLSVYALDDYSRTKHVMHNVAR